MIQRSIHKRLEEYLELFPITGLIGPRQVGKTTLAREIEQHRKKNGKAVIFLDMENPRDEAALQDPMMFLEPLRETLVIIDEVQRVPHLFPILRALIDRWRVPGRFLLLGSASPTLINASSESLAGRVGYCELMPLSLGEIYDSSFSQSPPSVFPMHFFHLLRGGFPPSFLASSEKKSMTWRREFIRTYTERELPQLGMSADPKLTRTLLTMLAHYHGQIWNVQPFAASLGVSAPTVSRYVRFLEDSFLFSHLQPYSVNLKKRLVKSPKAYLRDSGLVTALLGISSWEQLAGHPQLGALWEGYVIEQIRSALQPEQELLFYRTHEGAECDVLICEHGMPLYAVEIKYTSAPKVSKGFRNVIADIKTERNFLVVPESMRYQLAGHIEVISLQAMLKQLSHAE